MVFSVNGRTPIQISPVIEKNFCLWQLGEQALTISQQCALYGTSNLVRVHPSGTALDDGLVDALLEYAYKESLWVFGYS